MLFAQIVELVNSTSARYTLTQVQQQHLNHIYHTYNWRATHKLDNEPISEIMSSDAARYSSLLISVIVRDSVLII